MTDKNISLHDQFSVKPEDLRYRCDPGLLEFESTEELEPLEEVIGQDRAVRSLEFGLSMQSFGYNIYAAGPPGTGKKSLLKTFVERLAAKKPVPPDIVFLHNFSDPDNPRAIKVPAGIGNEFNRDMEELVEGLRQEIPKALQSEDYEKRRTELIEKFQLKRAQLIESVQVRARKKNLALKGDGAQILAVPVVNGEEMTPEQFERLSEEEQGRIREQQKEISEEIQDAYREIRELQQRTQEHLKDLDRRIALIAAGHLLSNLRNKYIQLPEILDYLKAVQQNVLDNLSDFLQPEREGQPMQALMMGLRTGDRPDALSRYRVNVIVDNSRQKGAPVVIESHPTYRNLIGCIEREAAMGTLYTNFTMIRAGSILKANGGFLIVDIADLLPSPFAWESLKRVIQNCEVKIEDVSEQYGLVATAGLRPQPVSAQVKVVIIGNPHLYGLLYSLDEDFQKLFKVKSDFDVMMKRDHHRIGQYAHYVRRLCEGEKLLHFDRGAVAGLIEYSARIVSDQNRLSLRFSEIADIIREASYWASRNGGKLVGRSDVERAIEERNYRSNLLEERLQEMIDEKHILIDAAGEKVGQINGLSIYSLGDYTFGKPTRITAQISVGDKGVVNIEREAHLSGNIHDKGVLILSGYLHGKYGNRHPLALNASICFEQSYAGVDGDSASSTELYAVLSSLSGAPLRQSIAVTSSVNQLGTVQPIGGVNEKIEGFFTTCKLHQLTGEQGVLIPRQNIRNLMLKDEVIEAVREGKFHIYAISTIDEGLEILTGVPAGALQADGTYPPDSIHGRVQKRLDEIWEEVQHRLPTVVSAQSVQ
ncbi:MAG: AAA family ATPase [Acidobacteria bacterium]|nr:AAA family ATPase [Acidobacteriota bacterium]